MYNRAIKANLALHHVKNRNIRGDVKELGKKGEYKQCGQGGRI